VHPAAEHFHSRKVDCLLHGRRIQRNPDKLDAGVLLTKTLHDSPQYHRIAEVRPNAPERREQRHAELCPPHGCIWRVRGLAHQDFGRSRIALGARSRPATLRPIL
jgi:hypothetical protein